MSDTRFISIIDRDTVSYLGTEYRKSCKCRSTSTAGGLVIGNETRGDWCHFTISYNPEPVCNKCRVAWKQTTKGKP